VREKKFQAKKRFDNKRFDKSNHKSFEYKKSKQVSQNFSRFKLYIEYEGTRYSGWQKQENAKTIQGSITNAAIDVFGDDFKDLQGSGRTDSGIHAINQIAHLDAKTMLAPEIIKMKLNDLSPHDINILEIEKINKDFHARHDAKSRSYIYQISRRRTAFS
jgi:tRNA pseudouridine38-40 synthase